MLILIPPARLIEKRCTVASREYAEYRRRVSQRWYFQHRYPPPLAIIHARSVSFLQIVIRRSSPLTAVA